MTTEPRNRREVLLTLAVPAFATAALVQTKNSSAAAEDLTVDKVPAPVKRAAHRVVKDAKWDSAQKGNDEGQDYYELFGTHEKGQTVSCQVTADGKVTSIELQIDSKDVPKVVITGLNKVANFKPETALALYEGDDIHDLTKTDPTYLLSGTTGKNKDISVEITAKGEVVELKQEIDFNEVPKLISDTLASKAPKYKPVTVHRITRNEKVAGHLFANPKHQRDVIARTLAWFDADDTHPEQGGDRRRRNTPLGYAEQVVQPAQIAGEGRAYEGILPGDLATPHRRRHRFHRFGEFSHGTQSRGSAFY